MKNFVLSSESVTMGHPDKLCDQISDAIVDAFLCSGSPCAVGAECAVANGVVFVSVLNGSSYNVDIVETVRRVIGEAGYHAPPFDFETCTVLTNINHYTDLTLDLDHESAVASRSVTAFGYACRHTPVLMPFSIWGAHALARQLDDVRRSDGIASLMPDGQTQVTVSYKDRQPVRVSDIILTTSTSDESVFSDKAAIREEVITKVIKPAFSDSQTLLDENTRITVQPAAPLPIGGPANHAGLTGRKIADDGYGGFARLSASALSGKDPSRIDRISTYAARHIAKCIVAAELAGECEVQLSFGQGQTDPLSVEVDTFNSGRTQDENLSARVQEVFDLRVGAIIERFGLWDITRLRNGRFFQDIAVYGQMGREDLDAPWEDVSPAQSI